MDAEEIGGSAGLTASDWETRERRDEEAVAELEKWLAEFERRAQQREQRAAEADQAANEKRRLFRRQLAIDLAEERHWAREEDRHREEDEIVQLSIARDEDELAAAVLKVMTRGTVEARQRSHEERICSRRKQVEQLRSLAAERRAAAAAEAELTRTQHTAAIRALDERLRVQRVQDEEERRRRAQEWEEILAERRRMERARERDAQHRRLRDEVRQLTHQRIVEREWAERREREEAASAAAELLRAVDGCGMRAVRGRQYQELLAAKAELLERASSISELVRQQMGSSSCIGLLCNAAENRAVGGQAFRGLRRLLDATLRPTALSPTADDAAVAAVLRGPSTCDQQTQTAKGGAKDGKGKPASSPGR
eukprot:TRINITY_DN59950_c0_g1_i1.p2 TRINITY_DN59950_c0_g1~~TRINITY_DN59950_c0_g1_i1.p2  ORF type:complete len:368 (+),score=156.70 TRINITY_DN59950_c0_g1_i1:86-1189(+)